MERIQPALAHHRASAKRKSRPKLRSLHRRAVEIRLVVSGDERVIVGTGAYASDSRLGGVLRIHCDEGRGSFEILIRECEWRGEITPSKSMDADYSITIGTAHGPKRSSR